MAAVEVKLPVIVLFNDSSNEWMIKINDARTVRFSLFNKINSLVSSDVQFTQRVQTDKLDGSDDPGMLTHA